MAVHTVHRVITIGLTLAGLGACSGSPSNSVGVNGGASGAGTSSVGKGGSEPRGGSSTGGSSGGTSSVSSGGSEGGNGNSGGTASIPSAGTGGSLAGAGSGQGGSGASAGGIANGAGAGAGGAMVDNAGGSSVVGGSGGTSSGGTSGAGAAGAAGASSGGVGGTSNTELATLVPDPSWTCGLPEGLVAPSRGSLVFQATLDLGESYDVGNTQYGKRRVLDVKGGTVKGDKVQATFLSGGLQMELGLANGSVEYESVDMLRSSDGSLIYLRSCGVAASGTSNVRFVPDFEVANNSSLAWLNKGTYVGTRVVDEKAKRVELTVYDVTNVAPADPKVRLTDPSGVPNQPWECSTTTGRRGDMIFTEDVKIGSSLSVGASKRGTRNVIPITGGTMTGRVTGKVLVGGADFQIINGGSAVLDARYTLQASDGEFIVVRNCGPFGALIPLFEARADGPYAFLNTNKYVSSDPGSAAGGVSITFYARQ